MTTKQPQPTPTPDEIRAILEGVSGSQKETGRGMKENSREMKENSREIKENRGRSSGFFACIFYRQAVKTQNQPTIIP